MEDRGNIRVTNTRRRPGFAEKTKPCRFITEISFTDDFQSPRAVQINVERLVSDSPLHRDPTRVVSHLRPSPARSGQIAALAAPASA